VSAENCTFGDLAGKWKRVDVRVGRAVKPSQSSPHGKSAHPHRTPSPCHQVVPVRCRAPALLPVPHPACVHVKGASSVSAFSCVHNCRPRRPRACVWPPQRHTACACILRRALSCELRVQRASVCSLQGGHVRNACGWPWRVVRACGPLLASTPCLFCNR
jgi:hypothetical protein